VDVRHGREKLQWKWFVLFCVRLEKLDTTTMVVVYAGSFPPDPKADAENFQRKQAEYEAAYRHTGEPRMLYEALLNARASHVLSKTLGCRVGSAFPEGVAQSFHQPI
jgi:ethanolamine utilization microcompartment shell protein EutL